jgi:tetratricopeptide (TPR) repeat protein
MILRGGAWIFAVVISASLHAGSSDIAERYLSVLANNPASEQAAARLWEMRDVYGGADGLLVEMRERLGGHPMAPLALGEIFLQSGDREAAAAALGTLVDDPPDMRAVLRLAGLLMRAERPERAREVRAAAADRHAGDPIFLEELAQAAAAAGGIAEARMYWQMVADSGSADQRIRAAAAIISLHAAGNDHASAAEAARQLVENLAADHWFLPTALKQLFFHAERAGTIDALEESWKALPVPQKAGRLAALSGFRGDVRGRLHWLRESLGVEPGNVAIRRELAHALLAAGRVEEADAEFAGALKLAPADSGLAMGLAETAALLGDEVRALENLENSLRLSHSNSMDEKLAALRRLGLNGARERTLREAVQPNQPETTFALADFLDETGRTREAMNLFESLPDTHALHVADWLRNRSLIGTAETWVRRAIANDPSDPAGPLLLADILQSRGAHSSARDVLVHFAESAGQHAIDEDFDRRLFMVMRTVDGNEDAALRMASARTFAENLEREARAMGAGEPLRLRAARWARWVGDNAAAVSLLREAPPSLAASLALAPALDAMGLTTEAIAALENAKKFDSSRAFALDREIARMESASGQNEAAIHRLNALLESEPTHPAILKELAAAMEVNGNAFAALPIWKRAFAAAQPKDKAQLLKPILACYARLGQPTASVLWLAQAAREIPNDASRRDFCTIAARHVRANDQEDAWARVLQDLAREDPGWLARARDFNPHIPVPVVAESFAGTPDATRSQREEARTRGDYDLAETLARQLMESREATPADAIALAHILESAGKIREAIQSWDMVTIRYGLSPETLAKAASAFAAHGEHQRAEAAWRKAAGMGKIPPAEMLQLGRLSASRGERARALADYSSLLHSCPPDPSQAVHTPPVPIRLFPRRTKQLTPQEARLAALMEVGVLLANSPERDSRIRSLAEGGAMERAWALAGAGEFAEAIDLWLEGHRDEISEEESRALIALALEGGIYDRIPHLVWNDNWKSASAAWRDMLEAGWRPHWDGLHAGGIQEWPAHFRIQCADLLASHGALRAAERMGDPAGLSGDELSAALFRRAGWQLALRMPDRAAESLDRLLASAPAPTSFESVAAPAIRARYLLEPEQSRARWAEATIRHVRTHGAGARAQSFVSALLAAVARDDRAFRHAARQWLEIGGYIHPTRIMREGAILEGWHLPAQARELYRMGLEADPAISALRGEFPAWTALQSRLVSSRIIHASSHNAKYLAREWLAQGAKSQELLAAAAEASGMGQFQTAQSIYQSLIETRPASPVLIHNMLAIARFPDCFPHALLDWFHSASPQRREALGVAAILQLSDALAAEGRIDDALGVLTAPGVGDPEGKIALRRAALHTALGSVEAAATAIGEAGSGGTIQPGPVAEFLAAEPSTAREAVEEFLAGNPSAIALLEAVERLPSEAPALLNALGPDRVEDILPEFPGDAALTSRSALTRLALARHFGTLPQLRETMRALWDSGRGEPLAAEILTRIAIEENNPGAINHILGEFLGSGKASPASLEGLAQLLLESGHPKESVRIYEYMDLSGIASHAVTLAFAEALWKAGRRTEAIDIAEAMTRAAAIDPALRVSLAAFWVSVDRPHRALAEIERENLPPLVKYRLSTLAATARSLLAERINNAPDT